MIIIKKFPASAKNDHGRETIAPLAQIGRIAKDMAMVAQQSIFVKGHKLRDLPGVGHRWVGRLLGSRPCRAAQHHK